MENENGVKDEACEEDELRVKVATLKQELRECRAELSKLQKQLSQSERLQRTTESYNEDLRKQVSAHCGLYSFLLKPCFALVELNKQNQLVNCSKGVFRLCVCYLTCIVSG